MQSAIIRLLGSAASIWNPAPHAKTPARPKVPSSSDLKDHVRVFVELDGREMGGTFRGAAPDGSYAVLLDNGKLMAFPSVSLVSREFQ